MIGGYIVKDTGTTPAMYYGPAANNAHVTPSQRWTDKPEQALRFARESDAQTFIDTFLAYMAPVLAIAPHNETAA